MSVRRIVRWLLLAEAVLAAAIGLLLWRWLGLAPALAAAGGLLCVLLVRLAINANNFLMSAHGASATPAAFRLGPGGWLRLLLGEFKASMLLSSWYMPRAAAHTRVYSDARTPPVLLLHGYGCNSGYWFHLVQLFDAAHISHASLDLEPLGGDIDGYAPLVEQAAARLCAAAHARQLVIVAHSMGGLVARAWMRKYGSARVARVVTLGTPHHGSSLAGFAPGANAAQMRREGAWLRELAAAEDEATRALVTSIYTHHDNIVSPQTSSVLPGARNVEFGGVGHVALGSHPGVLAEVMGEIGALARTGEPEPGP